MPSVARRRIRPVSRETRFLRLRGLKCFTEVHTLVLEGWPPSRVAEFIQKEKGEYTDITDASLTQTISDYRSSLPKGEVVKATMPEFYARAATEVKEEFSALDEMTKLYKMQMERIQIDLAVEKSIKKLMPHTMTAEMRAAREMLHDIAELEMDLGLNKRHLGVVDVEAQVMSDVESRYDPSVARAMEKPESRRKLLGIAERFLTLASGEQEAERLVAAEEAAEEAAEAARSRADDKQVAPVPPPLAVPEP